MMLDETAGGRANHGMMPGDMTHHAAHCGSLQTALGFTDPGHRKTNRRRHNSR
jgi:hypothetical protein